MAMVLLPARRVTGRVVARFHESGVRDPVYALVPLTQMSATSSPLTTSVAAPAPAVNVRRK